MSKPVPQLPSEMLAAQIVEFNSPFSIKKIALPSLQDLKPHDLYLKVAVAGLCHTDLEYLRGSFPDITRPITGGHEVAGVVIACGSAVDYFSIGSRVLAGQTFNRCQVCEMCQGPELYRQYCPNRESLMSVHRNGGFQEYLVVDGREATIIPDDLSFTTATPLACAGMTSWRGVRQCELQQGSWIGIVGSGGGLGHLAIQFAKVFGYKVMGIDAKDDGISLSKEVGADVVLDARMEKAKLLEEVHKNTDGKGVDAALNVSGAKSAVPVAIMITRNHGCMVQVGLVSEIIVPFQDLIYRNIKLKGSWMASRGEIQEMLHTVVKHKIRPENHLFYGLNEIPRAVEMLEHMQYRGKASIVIDENAPVLLPGVDIL